MTKDEILKSNVGLIPFLNNIVNTDFGERIHGSMDEYAKQQAVEFFRFCLPGSSDFEPHVSSRYDQFIESQNKKP